MRVTADRLISVAMTGTFICAAGFSAVASYTNIYDLCVTHGGGGISARLTPLSVDILILAASLAMLWANLRGEPVPWPVRAVLFTAVGATVAGNMLYGLPAGPIGAARSAWPGFAFVATIETGLWLVRKLQEHRKAAGGEGPAAGNYAAAMASYAATAAAGNPWSANQLQAQFGLTRAQARKICAPAEPPAGAVSSPGTASPRPGPAGKEGRAQRGQPRLPSPPSAALAPFNGQVSGG